MPEQVEPQSSQGFQNGSGDAPPFLGSWKRIYLAILSYLFALLVLLWIISEKFDYR